MTRSGAIRVRAVPLLALAALVVTGCGGGGRGGAGTSRTSAATSSAAASPSSSTTAVATTTSTAAAATTTSTAAAATSTSTARRRRPRGAPVGTTQHVDAGITTVSVTVTRVLDPLRGSGAVVLPGMRPVGVLVTIADTGDATYDSTASGDWSLLSTAGAASPLFIKRGVCQTRDVDFESLIGPGQVRGGCVAFSVPRRARILSVRFSPHSRPPGSVIWR